MSAGILDIESSHAASRPDLAKVSADVAAIACRSDEESIPLLVDSIIDGSISCGASDIHLESRKSALLVRFRIDGQLLPVAEIPKVRAEYVFSRLKLMARVAVYRRRTPQDGRLSDADGLPLRASFMPTLYGEKAVLRIAGCSGGPSRLDDLGIPADDLQRLKRALEGAQGTVLFTGPCSSGKTTTIYAALRHLLKASALPPNIATLEDPIEQEIDGINQSQIDTAGGLTFASGLRTLLRQDPNVLVVGEIRDVETANALIQAGLSGHLTIGTLHCGSAAQVFARLLHMEIEPFLVASAVTASIAQRLVRRLCTVCRTPVKPAEKERAIFASLGVAHGSEIYSAVGCPDCNRTGYRGRLAIFEIATPDAPMRELVMQGASTAELHIAAQSCGMTPLMTSGLKRAAAGDTTLEEIARVVA